MLETLRMQNDAFLVTRDANARVVVRGHNVRVAVQDSVYSFNSTGLLRTAKGYLSVNISLNAQATAEVNSVQSVPSS